MSTDSNDEIDDAGDEAILEQMDQVRGKLDNEIDRLNEGMQKVFDWQSYVKAAPLTSVGVAAAVGYFLAPAIRSRPIHVNVPAPQKSEGGILSSISTLITSAAVRMAISYLTNRLTSPAPDTVPQDNDGDAAPFRPGPDDQPFD